MTPTLQPGALLNGRYRVVRVLGTGAFGRVYLAEDAEDPSNPPMAIKELLAMEFSSADEQRDAITWFKREVSTLLTLDHSGIPAIHGYWTAHRTAGPMYLAMDFVPGKTLAEIHAEHGGHVPWRQVATWGADLCDVLAYLHGRTPPFVFRDLKPANVLIDERSDRPVLIDFGLARQLIPAGGTAVGTWGYVPYEQVLGRAEPRSDLYALGAVMHALVSGRHPDVEYRRLLRGGQDLEGALRLLFPPLETLVPSLSPAFAHAVAASTAFDAEDRFSSAQALATVLRGALVAPMAIVMPGPVAPAEPKGHQTPSESPAPPASMPAPGSPADAPGAPVASITPRMGLVVSSPSGATPPVTPPAAPEATSPDPPTSAAMRDAPPPAPARDAASSSTTPVPAAAPAVESVPLLPVAMDSLPSMERLPDITPPLVARRDMATAPDPSSTLSPKADPQRLKWWQRGTGGTSAPPVAMHLTVAAHGGDCTSIAEAIRRARPGARIDVRPGVYSEGLLIDRAVEIVGIGKAEEIVIEAARSSCMLMHCESARVSNVTLRCSAGLGRERYYAVTIPTGHLELEDCLIVSDSLACVAIHGEGAHPVLRRCTLHNSGERALAIYNQARGLIEDCEIVGSTIPVRISSQANPTLLRCHIHHGRFGGVFVVEHGRGILEDCDIVDNAHHGVAIRQGSTPVIRRCRINRNGWSAISASDSSGAIVEYCDLTNNVRSAWDIKESAKPRVDRAGNKEF